MSQSKTFLPRYLHYLVFYEMTQHLGIRGSTAHVSLVVLPLFIRIRGSTAHVSLVVLPLFIRIRGSTAHVSLVVLPLFNGCSTWYFIFTRRLS